MRSNLRRFRSAPDETAPDETTPGQTAATTGRASRAPGRARAAGRRVPARATGLAAGGLAMLGLAAAPVGSEVTETVTEAVADVMAVAVTSQADGDTAEGVTHSHHDREVRTVVAEPEGPTEPAAYERPAGAAMLVDATVEEAPSEPEPAVEAAAEETEPAPEEESEPAPEESTGATAWDRLADCESGDWDADGNPIPGTARWDYGVTFAHEGYEQFEGGLNFDPGTWDSFRDPGMPDHAGHASRAQQIAVGERVQAAQGWGAWPVCSEKIGLR